MLYTPWSQIIATTVEFAVSSSISRSNELQCCVVIDATQREAGEKDERVQKDHEEQHKTMQEELES